MSCKPRKKTDRELRLKRFKENWEVKVDMIYLQSLELELKNAKRYHKLQKFIHKKQGWKDYTC